jgi:CubicO group peptidase (beta-lactamase class C family)
VLRKKPTHITTAGFGYSFFNNELLNFAHPAGFDEFSGDIKDILQPLTFQPGEGWQYGVNIDYAGLALERLTKTSLNDYCHKNIFEPLGLKNISMFPTADMKKKLAFMHQRKPDGTIIARDHLLRKPLVVESAGVKDVFNSAGAGAFSKPADYARMFFCWVVSLETLTISRNHCNAAERWHFANDRREDSQEGNSRSHVHESN